MSGEDQVSIGFVSHVLDESSRDGFQSVLLTVEESIFCLVRSRPIGWEKNAARQFNLGLHNRAHNVQSRGFRGRSAAAIAGVERVGDGFIDRAGIGLLGSDLQSMAAGRTDRA